MNISDDSYHTVPEGGYSGEEVTPEKGVQETLNETPLDEAGARNSQAGGRRPRAKRHTNRRRRVTRRRQPRRSQRQRKHR